MTRTNSAAWLQAARQKLSASSEEPALEAQLLLSHILSRPRAWLLAHPETSLSAGQLERLDALLDAFASGQPLPYLLGRWEFYGLDFLVTPDVLIPRPETELLVEEGLAWVKTRPGICRVADVGTGSGCIAASLAKHAPGARIVAMDISFPALRVSACNLTRLGLQERVGLVQCDLLSACAGPFDLVCANLPYIPSSTLTGLEVARYEPPIALDGGPDGLRLIERLLIQSTSRLAPGGLLLLEIEAGQGESARELGERLFPDAKSGVSNDLAGKPRLLRIETASS